MIAKISIIVPVYRVELYLQRCVDSILNQTFHEFELILVDDGSPDKCGEICNKYAEADSRIHVIHKKNGGLSSARNAGLNWCFRNSTSDWISFVDSDDWLHPLYLELLHSAVMETELDIAIGGYMKTTDESPREQPLDNPRIIRKKTDDYYKNNIINATVSWGKLYRKQCFIDIRFPEGRIHEDEFTTYRILFRQDYVAVVDQPIYYYYQNKNGIMLSEWSPAKLDAVKALEEQLKYFIKLGRIDIAAVAHRRLINNITQNIDRVNNATTLSAAEKKKHNKWLSKKLKYLIVRYHKYEWLPYHANENNKKLYTNAFATIRIGRNLWKHLKKILKHVPILNRIWKRVSRFWDQRKVYGLVTDYSLKTCLKRAVLINSPLYRNLGDQAIALAELECLDKLKITCCDFPWTYEDPVKFARMTSPRKLVLFQGGGNLGQLWPKEESRFRKTIQAYKKNQIIVFPQTIYFDLHSAEGCKCFEESKAIYESHQNMLMFVREQASFSFMKEHMPGVRVQLAPDMVMALNWTNTKRQRNGVMICIREDKEGLISVIEYNRLLDITRKYFDKHIFTDTASFGIMSIDDRRSVIVGKLSEFSSASLVITDRLHGMIFAAITETPCIVLDSLSHKIRGCYEWIKNLDYIRFAEDVEEIPDIILELKNVTPKYNRDEIEKAMQPLYSALIKATK